LIQKIEVIENKEFTKAFERLPIEHRARVTVLMKSGEQYLGESGGDKDDLSAPKSDAQIEEKFYELTERILGCKRASAILKRLWRIEELENMSAVPSAFVIE
jgi:2-methylcitrate dehydratase PrpD